MRQAASVGQGKTKRRMGESAIKGRRAVGCPLSAIGRMKTQAAYWSLLRLMADSLRLTAHRHGPELPDRCAVDTTRAKPDSTRPLAGTP
jgi:hypothetical protein